MEKGGTSGPDETYFYTDEHTAAILAALFRYRGIPARVLKPRPDNPAYMGDAAHIVCAVASVDELRNAYDVADEIMKHMGHLAAPHESPLELWGDSSPGGRVQ